RRSSPQGAQGIVVAGRFHSERNAPALAVQSRELQPGAVRQFCRAAGERLESRPSLGSERAVHQALGLPLRRLGPSVLPAMVWVGKSEPPQTDHQGSSYDQAASREHPDVSASSDHKCRDRRPKLSPVTSKGTTRGRNSGGQNPPPPARRLVAIVG